MEPDAVEVKAAHHPRETPKVTDSLSALANRPGGGIILFGLEEKQGFKVVGVGNPEGAFDTQHASHADDGRPARGGEPR